MLISSIGLMIYFALVGVLGTIGNSIILFAYFNQCGASTSTTFIVILACVDLWTCSVVIPCIGIMEYNDFGVNTLLCRFYSFSKIIIIVSSFIMSAIAFDRFFSIALPHLRIMTPRFVKVLLTILISIAIFLGILTALAFSSQPWSLTYAINYTISFSDNNSIAKSKVFVSGPTDDIATLKQSVILSYLSNNSTPKYLNMTNFSFEHVNTRVRCFADVTTISDNFREILKHVSNKIFFLCIAIVTVLYTITYILALKRQAPRLRALKQSINVLDRYDRYDSVLQMNNNPNDGTTAPAKSPSCCTRLFFNPNHLTTPTTRKLPDHRGELSSYDEYELNSLDAKVKNIGKNLAKDLSVSPSEEETIVPLHHQQKTVSFNIERPNTLKDDKCISSPINFEKNNNTTRYKLNCLGAHRQILVTIHLQRPKFPFAFMQRRQPIQSPIISNSDGVKEANTLSISSNSGTLKRQLKRHRIKQIRMASTFLIITLSFIVFYLPSILNAERIIKSPIWIYYLYLSTHALNPIIYCFMNESLRLYVLSMLKCAQINALNITNFERSVNTR
ncbi:unnamed protein product [Didymodactylos carnosus]|uniref:G-protein coupled receptors family 1 profile domain-containing protein n=1 Tax=Didymodactylos carnosus TaxID=1234261 RepID=A0A815WWL3_9BILA|nr:unnamed protein product [Didymodactylos carnosus]CAF4410617.1 unnamed protein product [Didymodactylos carnosus]